MFYVVEMRVQGDEATAQGTRPGPVDSRRSRSANARVWSDRPPRAKLIGGPIPQPEGQHVRSIRISAAIAPILIVGEVSGCGSGSAIWPAGTEVILVDPNARQVYAEVPVDQRAIVKRRSLLVTNQTPAVVVDDLAYPALARNPANQESPNEPVRVKLTDGANQGVEILIRRQDVAPVPATSETWAPWSPLFFLALIVTAASLSLLETLVLRLRKRREKAWSRLIDRPSQRYGFHRRSRMPRARIVARGDKDYDGWLNWVAARNARKKLQFASQIGRAT